MEDIPHIGRNMVKLIDCFVYLISLSPSIRWTKLLWPSACRRRMVSDGARLIGFALISAIASRRFSSTGSFPLYICCGVPQGSVLGSFLFRLSPGELAATLGLSHFYALHMGASINSCL